MRWGRAKEGELVIDHRASPGLNHPKLGEGSFYQSATATCAHCNSIVVLRPDRSRPRGYCRKCDDYICDACVAKMECDPFTKKLDDELDRIEKLISNGVMRKRKNG